MGARRVAGQGWIHSRAVAVPLSEALVATVARRLRSGDLGYSTRQLYYGVCAELESPQVTRGDAQTSLGVLLMVGGLVAGIFVSIYCGLAVPFGLLITGMGLQRRRAERNRPTTRPLALGYDEFLADLQRLPLGADTLAGLIDGAARATASPDEAQPLVVCDRADSAAMLAANLRGRGITVVDEASAAVHLGAAQRVYALHDADARGCALPLRLRAAGVGAVVDLGLRPGHITGRHLQVVEGAPLIVPPDVAALLTADEIVWLAGGRRAELAILAPREIVDTIIAATSDGAAVARPPGFPEGIALSTVVPITSSITATDGGR
jgi:hypothetical protein